MARKIFVNLPVKDLTKSDNFHLTAAGVTKKTGVKFRGTVTWKFNLAAGKGTYRSDADLVGCGRAIDRSGVEAECE